MKHTVPAANWTTFLAEFIRTAEDGDTIEVHTEAMRELAHRAHWRMCPEKNLTFVVQEVNHDECTDVKFLEEIERTDTPETILALILENEEFLGYDPYYGDLRRAMLVRATSILAAREESTIQEDYEESRAIPDMREWEIEFHEFYPGGKL